MKEELINEMLDLMRICRDSAILKDDEEVALKLAVTLMHLACMAEAEDMSGLFEQGINVAEEAEYLQRHAGKMRLLQQRLAAV